MFQSATFKLTAWYLTILAVISLCFSFVVYRIALDDLRFGLSQQAAQIINDFPQVDTINHAPSFIEARQHIIGRLVFFNAIVLASGGLASYALARRTLQPIEAAHEQQKRFTADVSHELRTPLAALKMESEVALMDPRASAAQLKTALQSNVEEAEKLSSLVHNLLRLSRLDAMEQTLELQPVELTPVLKNARQQLVAAAKKHHVTLKIEPTKLLVRSDAEVLLQLLVILIDNAIKYSPAKGKVFVSSKRSGRSVSISIADHGQGISSADLKHVFRRFYRTETSRTSSGFGLGLSIAKSLAGSLGADLQLASKTGKGTVAKITLPAA